MLDEARCFWDQRLSHPLLELSRKRAFQVAKGSLSRHLRAVVVLRAFEASPCVSSHLSCLEQLGISLGLSGLGDLLQVRR